VVVIRSRVRALLVRFGSYIIHSLLTRVQHQNTYQYMCTWTRTFF